MTTDDSLAALRAARGMTAVGRTPGLNRAGELEHAAWRLWQTVAGQLAIAGRATCGDGGGPSWAREQLRLWVENVALDELDALGEALVAEAARTRPVAV